MESIPRGPGVYQWHCTPTNQIYIGGTIHLRERYYQHLADLAHSRHPNPYFQTAYDIYGASAFVFTVIELVDLSMLLEREQYYLDQTGAYQRDIGFNVSPTAGSSLGIKRSAVTRAKLSAVKRELMADPERRAAVSRQHAGKTISDEQKRKMSKALRGHAMSEANLANLLASTVGHYRATAPDGTVYEFTNLFQFCETHGLSYGVAKRNARNGTVRSDGWHLLRIRGRRTRSE